MKQKINWNGMQTTRTKFNRGIEIAENSHKIQ